MNENGIIVAKLNVLDAHDKLIELNKSYSQTLSRGAEDCLKKNPLSLAMQERSPYIYIFAHPRTDADGNRKKMYWQPRLTRPKAQDNSYLFRALSKSDVIEICWMIPARETWGQHKKGNISENEIVEWSISMYRSKRNELNEPHPDDLPEARMKMIYLAIAKDMESQKRLKPASLEAYQASFD